MSADPVPESNRLADTLDEARRLAACDWETLYSRELPSLIAGSNADRLVALIQALVRLESIDYLTWVGDLVAFVADEDLPALEACANGVGTQAAAAIVNTLRLQAPGLLPTSRARDTGPRATPPPICGPHHLALRLEDRVPSAGTPWSAFARRYHPSWVLSHATPTLHARLGSSNLDGPALAGCTRLMVVDGLSALAPDARLDHLDLQSPQIVLGDLGRGFVFHDETGRPSRSMVVEGEDPGDERFVLARECGLVASPARWVRQEWGVGARRENLNRFGGLPTFVQQPDYPDCVSCGDPMRFLVQFERGIECDDGSDLVGQGVLFTFLCAACRITAWFRQQT